MSYPPSLTTRLVQGRFVTHPDGTPAKGSVRVILDEPMQGPVDDTIIAPFDIEDPLDANGEFSMLLPANDDPQWTPSRYRVFIVLGEKVIRHKLHVPYNESGPINLADVLNTPTPTPGVSYVLYATRGVAGGVATLGSDGKVPSSQLPPSSGGGGGPVEWTDVQNKPATFPHDPIAFSEIQSKPADYPPSSHSHPTSDVTGLDNALSNKASTTALTSGLAGKSDTTHTHAFADVTGKPSTYPPATHGHTTGEVAGLDAALSDKASYDDLIDGLSDKADTTALTSGLAGKANVSHTHAQTDVTGLSTTLSAKADLVGGVVPTSQIPSISVIDFLGSVSTQVAMLALVGQKGDWCIRTDLGQTWVITGSAPSNLASWTAMPIGTSPVQTVNGQTGTVVLSKSDIGLGSADNTSDAGKPVSTATQTALDLKANLASPALSGTPTAPTATSGTNTTQIATTAFVTSAVAAGGGGGGGGPTLVTQVRVWNNTASTIVKGAAVYASGVDATSGYPTVALATATGILGAAFLGLAGESIAVGASGLVTTAGVVDDINTASVTAGSPVYLSTTAGTITASPASAANFRVLVGVVLASSSTVGKVLVRPSGPPTLGNGTANQLLGINTGASGQEYKTLNGTANQVAVTHGTNSITLSIPSNAALPGAPTTTTPTTGDNTTKVATTAFVAATVAANGPKQLVLSAAAAVPGGTATGTLIFRTAT